MLTTYRSKCPATWECIQPLAVILYQLKVYDWRAPSMISTEYHVYAVRRKETATGTKVTQVGVLLVPFFVVLTTLSLIHISM